MINSIRICGGDGGVFINILVKFLQSTDNLLIIKDFGETIQSATVPTQTLYNITLQSGRVAVINVYCSLVRIVSLMKFDITDINSCSINGR